MTLRRISEGGEKRAKREEGTRAKREEGRRVNRVRGKEEIGRVDGNERKGKRCGGR
jgi:hypothetical protein